MRLQHKDDQNDISNNQFIENPVLFNLVQCIKARRSSEFIVTEQPECMMSSYLNQCRSRGAGHLPGRFKLFTGHAGRFTIVFSLLLCQLSQAFSSSRLIFIGVDKPLPVKMNKV